MIHRTYPLGLSLFSDRFTGYAKICLLERSKELGRYSDPRWYFSAGREFGLWSLTLHAGFFRFEVIGPFQIRRSA